MSHVIPSRVSYFHIFLRRVHHKAAMLKLIVSLWCNNSKSILPLPMLLLACMPNNATKPPQAFTFSPNYKYGLMDKHSLMSQNKQNKLTFLGYKTTTWLFKVFWVKQSQQFIHISLLVHVISQLYEDTLYKDMQVCHSLR